MNPLICIVMNSQAHILKGLLCSVIVIVSCLVATPVRAQQNAHLVQDMNSTSSYIGNIGGYNADVATRVSGLNGSVASAWTPANNGYMVTPVGAGYSEGVGYANGYIGSTKGGPHKVSPGGGLGEPGGLPIGDVPVWFILVLAGGVAVVIYRKSHTTVHHNK